MQRPNDRLNFTRPFDSAHGLQELLCSLGLNVRAFQTGDGKLDGQCEITMKGHMAAAVIETNIGWRAFGHRQENKGLMVLSSDFATEGSCNGIPLVYPTVAGFNLRSNEVILGADGLNVMVLLCMNKDQLIATAKKHQHKEALEILKYVGYLTTSPKAHDSFLKVLHMWMTTSKSNKDDILVDETVVMGMMLRMMEQKEHFGLDPLFTPVEKRLILELDHIQGVIAKGNGHDINESVIASLVETSDQEVRRCMTEMFNHHTENVLRRMRLEMALQLLRSDGLRQRLKVGGSVAAIADYVGIESRMLNRWFKEHLDITPATAMVRAATKIRSAIKPTKGVKLSAKLLNKKPHD